MEKMIHDGKIPIKGGLFIDTYNQKVHQGISPTIQAGVSSRNHNYITSLTPPPIGEKTHCETSCDTEDKGQLCINHHGTI